MQLKETIEGINFVTFIQGIAKRKNKKKKPQNKREIFVAWFLYCCFSLYETKLQTHGCEWMNKYRKGSKVSVRKRFIGLCWNGMCYKYAFLFLKDPPPQKAKKNVVHFSFLWN